MQNLCFPLRTTCFIFGFPRNGHTLSEITHLMTDTCSFAVRLVPKALPCQPQFFMHLFYLLKGNRERERESSTCWFTRKCPLWLWLAQAEAKTKHTIWVSLVHGRGPRTLVTCCFPMEVPWVNLIDTNGASLGFTSVIIRRKLRYK